MFSRNRNKATTRRRGLLARLRSDSSGNTLAMVAAALVPIAGMIGSGLDMSRAYLAQAKLQHACDAGALAARRFMASATFTSGAEAEGERFFNFNFPDGTMGTDPVALDIAASADNASVVAVSASTTVPTTIMAMFGQDEIPIAVECDADQDYVNNDIMLVLDVTGSMNCAPGVAGGCGGVEQTGSKGSRLRTGALGLYRALEGAAGVRTRYGIMPYSGTVNVGRTLRTRDILRTTYYNKRACSGCAWVLTPVHIDSTSWSGSTSSQRIDSWRTNGSACIEDRPTSGNSAQPIRMTSSVSRNDIDLIARNDADTSRQWGRYDPGQEQAENQSACPSEASRLRSYDSAAAFQTAINTATARLDGGTFHDVGILWGARYLSPTGMFASENPTIFNDIPVNQHIVFMTDGMMDTSTNIYYYSTYGNKWRENRLTGGGTSNERHVARFQSACSRARAMGATVWVIALDVGNTNDIRPCATSADHFYTSDGSDLEEIFELIGRGIGRLRLTR